MSDYEAFLRAKIATTSSHGFEVAEGEVNPILLPHQRACVRWAVAGGRRALFEAFGLGKTVQQIEVARLTLLKAGGGRGLIVCPLGVRQEFARDAAMLGERVCFVRHTADVGADGIYLTNYESIRDGRLDPSLFTVVCLDEAACLRSFGSKTFSQFLFGPLMRVPYRFVATATPAPNQFLELIAYAHFLGIMDMGESKTRFFKRNSEKADHLTLLPHKEDEWWLWVASWALFLQRPSDLGPEFSDDGYSLPELRVHWHEVPVDHQAALEAGLTKRGQSKLFRESTFGVSEAAREKRDSLGGRVAKMIELLAGEPDEHWVIWHDLEAERHAIERAVPGVVSVYGSQDLDERERAIIDFSEGRTQHLAAKPVIAGSGCNLQYHCSRAMFLGVGYKFADFIQAIHRLYRYLQAREVDIHIIYAESERTVKDILVRKWDDHKTLTERMSAIIREHGLAGSALRGLTRSMGVQRQEACGAGYRCILNDAVLELPTMEADSVGLIVTSIPFSTQYEYTPSYHDLGHTDDEAHFFAQMDYLTPELFRVLQPGRVAAVHCKDRIVPGAMTGLGFQVVYPFHADCIRHYQQHGFAFLGMKTIATDVVRENNQTYRLGWTEQCKDGSRMGCGMPEYLLLFRKPPTESGNGYADEPVVKEKPVCRTDTGEIVPYDRKLSIVPGTGYSLARWQIDADGFARSSGDKLLTPEEIASLPWKQVYRLYRSFSATHVYDHEEHVRLSEALERAKALPVDFSLVPARSWHPDVWTDITRMRTLNGAQSAKGRALHLCPLQFDVVDRAIRQFSNTGDVVLDPFGGIMTVPYRAIKLGRKGVGIELNSQYWRDGAGYCEIASAEASAPSLFDLDEEEEE